MRTRSALIVRLGLGFLALWALRPRDGAARSHASPAPPGPLARSGGARGRQRLGRGVPRRVGPSHLAASRARRGAPRVDAIRLRSRPPRRYAPPATAPWRSGYAA